MGPFSGRLHQVPKQPKFYILQFFSLLFFLIIYPNPPCQVFTRATHVLGPVPLFKPARQKHKCKRAVPCRKKVEPFEAQAVPKTLHCKRGLKAGFHLGN